MYHPCSTVWSYLPPGGILGSWCLDQFIGWTQLWVYFSHCSSRSRTHPSLCDGCGSVDSCDFLVVERGKCNIYQKSQACSFIEILHFKDTLKIMIFFVNCVKNLWGLNMTARIYLFIFESSEMLPWEVVSFFSFLLLLLQCWHLWTSVTRYDPTVLLHVKSELKYSRRSAVFQVHTKLCRISLLLSKALYTHCFLGYSDLLPLKTQMMPELNVLTECRCEGSGMILICNPILQCEGAEEGPENICHFFTNCSFSSVLHRSSSRACELRMQLGFVWLDVNRDHK